LATIKDVARRAGVAISTVSAVLNRSAPVSEATIARVEAAVAAIGYMPHGAAQSLRSGRSRTIGLILPDITNPHFASVARVVESACLDAGYMAAIFSTSEDFDRERQILKMMRAQRVAGLIIIPTRSDAEQGTQLKAEIHVPTVLLDSFVTGLPYDVIKLDNVLAGRLATDHLLDCGHRRIAVTTGRDNITTGEDRVRGFLEAHAARHLAVDASLFLAGRFDREVAYRSTLARMRQPKPPTAIFAISNMTMMGVLLALRELGLSVPGDVSVAGIDDFDFAAILDPPPTVVAAPVAQMAQLAIDTLFGEIEHRRPPIGRTTLFEPKLVMRQSVAALARVPAE
jgi:LacI family transcriptional regulator